VLVLVQPIAEEKRLLLRWSGFHDDVRTGHPAVLHRVLLNLVTNALKYTDAGSVTVSAEALSENVVRFCVRDTGMGMPVTVKAQLAQSDLLKGERLPSSGGLGIALCQQMLAPMGSSLELIEDGTDTGSCLGFTVELPTIH
jgi:signal transduction histidine kinase